MTVFQRNEWTCDLCGSTCEEGRFVDVFNDPVVYPPKGWTAELAVPEDVRDLLMLNCCDACHECQSKPDWERYKRRKVLRDM